MLTFAQEFLETEDGEWPGLHQLLERWSSLIHEGGLEQDGIQLLREEAQGILQG